MFAQLCRACRNFAGKAITRHFCEVCVMAELMREQENARASRNPTALVSVSTPGHCYARKQCQGDLTDSWDVLLELSAPMPGSCRDSLTVVTL